MGTQDKEALPQAAQYLTINQDVRFPFDELEEYPRSTLQTRHNNSLPANLQGSRAKLEDVINAVGKMRRKDNPQDGYRILAELESCLERREITHEHQTQPLCWPALLPAG